jgi:dihydroorotate dehydrogenase electron transfer subunit
MFREKCEILENKKVAPGHFVLRLGSAAIAKNACPGRFVQITCGESNDPLLPRPFSFLTSTENDFSVLYQKVGKGTELLSELKKGAKIWVTGPLGNGFTTGTRRMTDKMYNSIVLVGGGVGIPPLYHLAEIVSKQKTGIRPQNIRVLLGARNKSLLLCENEFKKLGVTLEVATDDGSKGKKGFVTDIFEAYLKTSNPLRTRVYTCGPTPMLKAVSALAVKYRIYCEVSVEVPMACGFGACLGCAIKVKATSGRRKTPSASSEDIRYAIACVEGPVFKGSDILWD